MNYLAHLLLSGPDPDWRLGGLLGDFVKGPLEGGLPTAVEAGIRLHRRIDAITDDHPAYRDARSHFDSRWRRYAGIVLDIWFDHLLSSQWQRWHPQPLEDFCNQCWRDFHLRNRYIPPHARTFIRRAEEVNLFQSYRDGGAIAHTLEHVGRRLRRPMPLQQALPEQKATRDALQKNFDKLFADLTREAARFRQCYPANK
ncbi:acyl carrier protein phosphodiesterase [Microbulbifer thermotolerans]|uniref:ACP phosphodiesterase n=1 Tax=Microbulbifer thermotolerans TaxID=252514 RepID=A0AB35HXW3_MICTH|nr:ACP phosphodiesterase [Microbulbifer thermotolerans]MCX2778661.1 ACP phosphodiesterase [Microbulbifer thermotolerans]MCX2801622.1 ACP phosphodiesterase [Microbulbifer thermotolerans]MCX2803830.1 ACP phosphodiesterase [Microbulbifer thermotolerans]MCX2841028.1 ACP phosphodiesterase [Microbulbifer thermotolerans]